MAKSVKQRKKKQLQRNTERKDKRARRRCSPTKYVNTDDERDTFSLRKYIQLEGQTIKANCIR